MQDQYLEFSVFTNPGLYRGFLCELPDDIRDLGNLVNHQRIHRVTLMQGNTNANIDKRYGDMDEFPWYRLVCDDDVLPNVVSMIAELLRLDGRGFHPNRKVENKIVVTCRYSAILMASILKSKGIPCRVRAGFVPYFSENSGDHWINQYWNQREQKWITFDADGFLDSLPFDQYDMPEDKFDWAPEVWIGIRNKVLTPERYRYAGGETGLQAAVRALFHDFHCLMNQEILYEQIPSYVHRKLGNLSSTELEEIDDLAELMIAPDENFNELSSIWDTNKKFRILNSPLIGDTDHQNMGKPD